MQVRLKLAILFSTVNKGFPVSWNFPCVRFIPFRDVYFTKSLRSSPWWKETKNVTMDPPPCASPPPTNFSTNLQSLRELATTQTRVKITLQTFLNPFTIKLSTHHVLSIFAKLYNTRLTRLEPCIMISCLLHL